MRRVQWLVGAVAAALVLMAGAGSAAPPSLGVDACGPLLEKGDGSRWQCSFADEFDGPRLDRTTWLPQVGQANGSTTARACFIDDPSVIDVRGGSLRLSVRRAPEPVECAGLPADFVSAKVSTYHRYSQQYGRFEARMRVTETAEPGLQEAFWLWPDDRYPSLEPWPAAGEIDVAETYSQHPDLAIPYLHYTAWDNGGPQPGTNTAWDCQASRGEWHTYTLTWSASRIRIDVDGEHCLTNQSGDPAFQKPYILVLSQALGVGENAYVGDSPLPATAEIDYVKAWS